MTPSSPQVLDVEMLLAPVAGPSPTGTDLRGSADHESPYNVLKRARGDAAGAERALARGDNVAAANWKIFLDRGPQVLTGASKDLEVATWMTEAGVRLHGFPGLRDGFKLLRGLVERYWANVYPSRDADGDVTRVAAMRSLNGDEKDGTLIQPIRRVPLFRERGGKRFDLVNYGEALELEGFDAVKQQQRAASGTVTLEQFRRAATETPAEQIQTLLSDLAACDEEFDKLTAAIDERFVDGKGQKGSFPSSRVRAALEACREVIEVFLPQSTDAPAEGSTDLAEPTGADTGPVSTTAPRVPGKIQSRREAFEQLKQVSQYFKQAEPHTPVSFLLDKAVRWGGMTLPDVFAEMIEDNIARQAAFKLAGIPWPEEAKARS